MRTVWLHAKLSSDSSVSDLTTCFLHDVFHPHKATCFAGPTGFPWLRELLRVKKKEVCREHRSLLYSTFFVAQIIHHKPL